MNEHRDALIQEFKDKAYRHAYGEEFLVDSIATQIKVLREDRNLTQDQLSELAKMKQARISLMESGDYSTWNLRTLQRLAGAFDVALMVRFEPFSRLIELVESTSRENLSVNSFDMELPLLTNKVAATKDAVLSGSEGMISVTMNNATPLNLIFPAAQHFAAYNMGIGSILSNQFECDYPCITPSAQSDRANIHQAA